MIAISALFQHSRVVSFFPSLHYRDKRFVFPVHYKVHVINLLGSETKIVFFFREIQLRHEGSVRQNVVSQNCFPPRSSCSMIYFFPQSVPVSALITFILCSCKGSIRETPYGGLMEHSPPVNTSEKRVGKVYI